MSEIFRAAFPLTEDVIVSIDGKKVPREEYHLDTAFDHISFAGKIPKGAYITVERPPKTETFLARG